MAVFNLKYFLACYLNTIGNLSNNFINFSYF